MAEMLGKKKQASVDISFEMEHMELEHELAFAATCSWARSCWGEAKGLMTCMKLGRSRSTMQPLGIRSWGLAGAVTRFSKISLLKGLSCSDGSRNRSMRWKTVFGWIVSELA